MVMVPQLIGSAGVDKKYNFLESDVVMPNVFLGNFVELLPFYALLVS